MLRIGCYSRKSIYSDKSDSTEVQYRLATEYCESHYNDYELYRYEDEGYTGANTIRPAYNRLVSDITDKRLDIVICYKIDRISRNVLDFSNFFALLSEHKIEFVCIKDQIDTSTPLGRAMMYICSVFAQMERETIAERVADNMIELAKSGKWSGGRAPIGYKLEKVVLDGKKHTILAENPDTVDFFYMIFNTFLDGNYTLTSLETYFKNHHIKTLCGNTLTSARIHAILKNPVYAAADQTMLAYFKKLGCTIGCDESKFTGQYGINIYNKSSGGRRKKHINNPPSKWIISVGYHKPLVSSQRWLAVQERFGQNVIDKSRKHYIGILKGVLKCSCGHTMRVKVKHDKIYDKIYQHYFCQYRMIHGVEYCNATFTPVKLLDDTIIDLLKSIAVDKTLINNYMGNESEQLLSSIRSKQKVQKDIKILNTKVKNLTETLGANSNSTAAKYIVSEIEKIDKQIASLKFELMEIDNNTLKLSKLQDDTEDKYEAVCHIVNSLETADYEELNELVKSLLKECIWDGKSLKVKL